MTNICYCCFILCIIFVSVSFCELPVGFIGNWQGIPQFNVVGPWGNQTFNFTIEKFSFNSSEYDGWMMRDYLSTDAQLVPGTRQQFWVVEDKGVVYCGNLPGFFSSIVAAPIVVPFLQHRVTDTEIQWCLGNCQIQWTLTLKDSNTLVSEFFLKKPVKHLLVTLKRVLNAPPNFNTNNVTSPIKLPKPCNVTDSLLSLSKEELDNKFAEFATNDYQQHVLDLIKQHGNAMCPYSKYTLNHKNNNQINNNNKNKLLAKYQHCYRLSPSLQYDIAWNYHGKESKLEIAITAPVGSSSNWIGLGFEPSPLLGMGGAGLLFLLSFFLQLK